MAKKPPKAEPFVPYGQRQFHAFDLPGTTPSRIIDGPKETGRKRKWDYSKLRADYNRWAAENPDKDASIFIRHNMKARTDKETRSCREALRRALEEIDTK